MTESSEGGREFLYYYNNEFFTYCVLFQWFSFNSSHAIYRKHTFLLLYVKDYPRWLLGVVSILRDCLREASLFLTLVTGMNGWYFRGRKL